MKKIMVFAITGLFFVGMSSLTFAGGMGGLMDKAKEKAGDAGHKAVDKAGVGDTGHNAVDKMTGKGDHAQGEAIEAQDASKPDGVEGSGMTEKLKDKAHDAMDKMGQ